MIASVDRALSFLSSESYVRAWKNFRKNSDEAQLLTADLSDLWSNLAVQFSGRRIRFLDVGVGDGTLTAASLRRSPNFSQLIGKIDLVDPSIQLRNAERILRDVMNETDTNCDIRAWRETAADWNRRGPNRSKYDVILASHVIYYLEPTDIELIRQWLSKTGRLVIVSNTAESLFARAWARSAPELAESLHRHYEWLNTVSIQGQKRILIKINQGSNADRFNEALLPLISFCDADEVHPDLRDNLLGICEQYRSSPFHLKSPIEIIQVKN